MQKARWGDAGIGLDTVRVRKSHTSRVQGTGLRLLPRHSKSIIVKMRELKLMPISITSGARAATTYIKVNINK